MLRLFAGLEIPDAQRSALALLQSGLPGVRWVARESLHLTLRFFGEIDETVAADLDAGLVQMAAPGFDVTLEGTGVFGGGKPHAVWAGLRPEPALDRLHAKVERIAQSAGLAPESRSFQPHVTLARLKHTPADRLTQWLETHGAFTATPFTVSRVALFSSRLARSGAIYRVEAAYDLA